jgi:carbon monoxide dehydrogenase subunit G
MAAVHIVRSVPAPSSRVWEALVDFAAHGRVVPLTRIRLGDGPIGPGWRFVAETGIGPVRFADVMEVQTWEPPTHPEDGGRFVIGKVGRLLGGYADVRVDPTGAATSLVTWTEEILLRPQALGRRLSPIVDPATQLLFGRTVDALTKHVVPQ